MKTHTHTSRIKRPVIAASLAFSLALTCIAQSQVINCIKSSGASWNDAQSWTEGNVPSQDIEIAIINGGLSAVVDSPVEAPIDVRVGNGSTPAPDGNLVISSDFKVAKLGVAVAAQSSGRVEQNAGGVYVQELNLSSMAPNPGEATYDLVGGNLSAETLTIGKMGPATLSIEGKGEVVSVPSKLAAGPQAVLRFAGSKDGYPSLNAEGEVTVEAGATLTVVPPGSGTKPGKFTLIQAREPLAGSFSVDLSSFPAGKARLLENERGVVLEVK